MGTPKRVAILVETSRAYPRGLLSGICQYQQQRGKWLTFFQPANLRDPPPPWLKKWKGDGIIVRIATQEMAKVVSALDIPVINLWNTRFAPDIPILQLDNERVIAMAIDHLRERGLERFAYVSEPSPNVGFDDRRKFFVEEITKLGFYVAEFSANWPVHSIVAMKAEQQRLASWIQELPKPVGILAMNDDVGMKVLEACRVAHVDVPDSVAVLGIDNDEFQCNFSVPPMSSIDLPGNLAGYAAAEWLDAKMHGRAATFPSLIKPRRVVTRLSTNILFANDPLVGKALRLIWESANDDKCADKIFAKLKVSRALMNSRFKNTIGRTVHDQIRRVRVQKAMEWISNTNEPLKNVAAICGFQTVQYFTRVFREMTGETPAAFREERQGILETPTPEQERA